MAKTGHPNFQLHISGPWRGIVKRQTWASSHSGTTIGTTAGQLAFVQAVWGYLTAFVSGTWAGGTQLFCSGYSYYNGVDSAALSEAVYTTSAAAVAAGFTQTSWGTAYTGAGQPAPPEMCVRLQAPVGNSSTGKPVHLSKFIHWAEIPTYSTQQFAFSAAAATSAAALGNGSLPGSLVLCSGSGKQGAWVPYNFPSNHQMQRRHKKKTTSGSSGLLSAAAQAALALLEDAL